MIRRKDEHKETTMENGFGGNGTIQFHHLATKEDLLEKGRLFSITTFKPGVSLGYHVHQGDFEVYHILKGQGTLNDNGTEAVLNPGDTAWVKPGQGHSLANYGSEDLVFIALILYA
ncbi:MAG TPA: cupin domain-containing protein [Bacillota bacterium]|nr:cupin domain-containing protein [Bacillota bacterium]HOA15980.1 cupin domain-containing protein [Bacillota bacterium]HOG52487.1 cupin domain-containing protein [Bacillota bacterium]